MTTKRLDNRGDSEKKKKKKRWHLLARLFGPVRFVSAGNCNSLRVRIGLLIVGNAIIGQGQKECNDASARNLFDSGCDDRRH